MSNIDDIKNWSTAGGALYRSWNVTGFDQVWHVAQVRDKGHRSLISTAMSLPSEKQGIVLKTFSPADLAWVNANGVPFGLRGNNLIQELTSATYRVPTIIENLPLSPLVWTNVNGVVNDQATVDYFADPAIWTKMGTVWASQATFTAAQSAIANPAWLMVTDDHEAFGDIIKNYCQPVVSAAPYGNQKYTWRANLQGVGIRVANYAAAGNTTDTFVRDFWLNQARCYRAFYSAFALAISGSWKSKQLLWDVYGGCGDTPNDFGLRNEPTVAQYAPALLYANGGGPAIYSCSGYAYSDFTSSVFAEIGNAVPKWERAEVSMIPTASKYRSVYVNISDNYAIMGKQNGKHEVITPQSYGGFCQWLMWTLRGKGIPFLLNHFTGSQQKPTDPFFSATSIAWLNANGYTNLTTLTQDDYAQAIAGAVDHVMSPVLAPYFIGGTSVSTGDNPIHELRIYGQSPLYDWIYPGDANTSWRQPEISVNTPRNQMVTLPAADMRSAYNPAFNVKVWGAITKIDSSYLIYLWTPCTLTGNVSVYIPGVGSVSVAAPTPAGNYWTINRGDGVAACKITKLS